MIDALFVCRGYNGTIAWQQAFPPYFLFFSSKFTKGLHSQTSTLGAHIHTNTHTHIEAIYGFGTFHNITIFIDTALKKSETFVPQFGEVQKHQAATTLSSRRRALNVLMWL